MQKKLSKKSKNKNKENKICNLPITDCPLCFKPISALPGTSDAICQNCGYKEPCCD